MLNYFYNKLVNRTRYRYHPEAVIVACFFNPENSPYRLLAFAKWYESIKHLNHRIIECVIGENKPQLPKSEFISTTYADSLLFHKETLLNKVINNLPSKYKYVFWLDTDVLFTNKDWLVDGVLQLQYRKLIQPFDYCIHLDENELQPNFNVDHYRSLCQDVRLRHKKLWKSFCSTSQFTSKEVNETYDLHGHVGFAWGARREVLDQCPLYDKALVGGVDHIIAHAAMRQIPHECIKKSFTDDLGSVTEWSERFSKVVNCSVGFVKGDLYHLWHGDIENRQYLKRVKEFTKELKDLPQDKNGFYKASENKKLEIKKYYANREVSKPVKKSYTKSTSSSTSNYYYNNHHNNDIWFYGLMGYYLGSHNNSIPHHHSYVENTPHHTPINEPLPSESNNFS